MAALIDLVARSAFEGMLDGLDANGVNVAERDGLGIATLQARKGGCDALRQRIRQSFGIDLPATPMRVAKGDVALICTAPQTWLAVREGEGNAFAGPLAQVVGDTGSIADQSDGYAVLWLSGPRVRELLARLVSVDVHDRVFGVGSVASSVAGHIGVTFWRLPDAQGAPAFELVLYRSFAGSFARMLSECIGGMGAPG